MLALRNIPAHARNTETAQTVLGRCCTEVELTDLRDGLKEDDREFFVTAWCSNIDHIEPQKLVFIPEPRVFSGQLDGQEQRMRRGLHYLVRVRLVAYQNFTEQPGTLPPADDNNEDDNADDDRGQPDDHRAGEGSDYWPTPRRDSEDDSPDSDPRHGRHIPFCD